MLSLAFRKMLRTKSGSRPLSLPPPLVWSKRIKYGRLYDRRDWKYRLYTWPFVIAYVTWAVMWWWVAIVVTPSSTFALANGSAVWSWLAYREFLFIPLAMLMLAHFLTFMSCFWSVAADVFITCRPATKPFYAQFIMVVPQEHCGRTCLCPLKLDPDDYSVLTFEFQQQRFVFDAELKGFRKLHYPTTTTIGDYRRWTGFGSDKTVTQTRRQFGSNSFKIVAPTFFELFKEHAVAPFFVFQVFCVGLWCLDEYWYYSVFTLIMLVVFESTVVQQRLRNIHEFRTMSIPPSKLQVRRLGRWSEIDSTDLLPGDLCALTSNALATASNELTVPADLLLLSGSCIVNEAMISGESTPMLKESIRFRSGNEMIELSGPDRTHLLFGGTKILQLTSEDYNGEENGRRDDSSSGGAKDHFDLTMTGGKSIVYAYVVRTGFGTLQGKLVRTMMFSSEHMTANTLESFMFILFLLVFAIAAAAYVLVKGVEDAERNRYQLLLEAALIITAVVPPELPMELSLAVNTSLMALAKLAIFCMEPFRIPFAGKIDICCFDKTGTLTAENLDIEGVAAGTSDSNPDLAKEAATDHGRSERGPTSGQRGTSNVCHQDTGSSSKIHNGVAGATRGDNDGWKEEEAFRQATKVVSLRQDLSQVTKFCMAACHSLFRVNDSVAGDPMEKATLDFVQWTISSNDLVVAMACNSGTGVEGGAKSKQPKENIRILHRFPFSSALKRMSVVAVHADLRMPAGKRTFVAVKGAPEVLQRMLRHPPSWYSRAFERLAQSGARVLALGYKPLSLTSLESARHLQRDQVENDLVFAGFVIFRCPLKPDSKSALRLLTESSHAVCMVTGDNALTAIHTARQLGMVKRRIACVDVAEAADGVENSGGVDAEAMAEAAETEQDHRLLEERRRPNLTVKDAETGRRLDEEIDVSLGRLDRTVFETFDFCFTGNALETLQTANPTLVDQLLARTAIFARASPSQKEFILTRLKSLGYITLMCGDGTNDVGALKQAHVGIALLDGKPEDLKRILEQTRQQALKRQREELEAARQRWNARFGGGVSGNDGSHGQDKAASALQKAVESMGGDEGDAPLVRLGDASVAAPFTSKISTVHAVCNVIRQGRCTLVTTIQMYKILALNSLISAYGLSVLHLKGVRYGDFQVTITGMLLAACFLFLSRSQPIEQLSPRRPQSNIFNAYLLTSVLGQFALHVTALVYVVGNAERWVFPRHSVGGKTEFAPGLVNTAVYLLSLLTQVSTFVVNYQGRPFRESLLENKPLRNALAIVSGIAVVAALEWHPEFNEWIQLVPMPDAFRRRLCGAMLGDFLGCFVIEWLAYWLFFNSKSRLTRVPSGADAR